MYSFLIGYIFILFDFNIPFRSGTLSILPAAIGYFIVLKGMAKFERDSVKFQIVKLPIALACTYSLVLFVMNLYGKIKSDDMIFICLGVVYTLVSLGISYMIVSGLHDVETKYDVELGSRRLMNRWRLMAIFQLAGYVSLVNKTVGGIVMMVNMVCMLLFLMAWYYTKDYYIRWKNPKQSKAK